MADVCAPAWGTRLHSGLLLYPPCARIQIQKTAYVLEIFNLPEEVRFALYISPGLAQVSLTDPPRLVLRDYLNKGLQMNMCGGIHLDKIASSLGPNN